MTPWPALSDCLLPLFPLTVGHPVDPDTGPRPADSPSSSPSFLFPTRRPPACGRYTPTTPPTHMHGRALRPHPTTRPAQGQMFLDGPPCLSAKSLSFVGAHVAHLAPRNSNTRLCTALITGKHRYGCFCLALKQAVGNLSLRTSRAWDRRTTTTGETNPCGENNANPHTPPTFLTKLTLPSIRRPRPLVVCDSALRCHRCFIPPLKFS